MRVGLPLGFVAGPGIPPILAQKDLRRAADLGDLAACLAETGGLRVPLVYEARPLALSPPAGFLPSLRVHAAVFAIVSYLVYSAITEGDCVSLTSSAGCSALGSLTVFRSPLVLLHLFVT